MSLCVFIAGKSAACLAGLLFSLSWTHSIEKTQWVEHWKISGEQLSLRETFVKGSGAGIDPAPHAVLQDGWYRWKPLQAVELTSISLANSELTPDNWKLCAIDAVTYQVGECIDFDSFKALHSESFTIRPVP
ncbi:uncharacterized protein DUF1850 [Limnobacter thiooxidans]|uniref:DUF1850 domain-containing protein n=1 Tax=Limnobacter thiooxidans TaxID=131080 RepID=A0AA86MCZ8_9BURK|nr:DUF1850 domain-containing protein [Limnobacter sp.]MCZ8014191.1 DUF1850 domain-containing protein [Limnobacter sp.]RZS38116.1 uncharacterized protein DUF1850 [Limnobacter thiooxidans]BET25436.1 DUF1850 domain-containing protein [Limnobacter thiooxidans]